MNFESTISTNPDARAAVEEVCEAVAGFQPDLAMLFVSPHYEDEYETLLEGIREGTDARNLVGCTGESIIGPDCEVEHAPALSLWVAEMPDVRLMPFVIDLDDVRNFESPDDWRDRVTACSDDAAGLVVLPEPFSFGPAVEYSLEQLDAVFPHSTIVGGMASGAERPGQNRLFLNDHVLRNGMVGISLSGAVGIEPVVSQGCRPIGEPFVITKAKRNVIQELRGRPAVQMLKHLFEHADPDDQALIQRGRLHVGSVADETLPEFRQGDFLIRNLMGIVEKTGIAVTTIVRPGQTIQFHVRDSASADKDMQSLVGRKFDEMDCPAAGGLMFSCNGRGTNLFKKPNHDIGVVNGIARDCRISGFFASGEIGPIGDRTFVHGFTNSLILFREP